MKKTFVGGLALALIAALAGNGCGGYHATGVSASYESPGHRSTIWYYNDGMRLYRMGYYDRAIVQFRIAVERDPDFWEAHYYLGDCYYQTGHYDRAVVYYDRVLVLHPDPVWVSRVNYNIGLVYEKTGKYDHAVVRYDRALKVKPGYGPAKRAKNRLIQVKIKPEKKWRDLDRDHDRGRKNRDRD